MWQNKYFLSAVRITYRQHSFSLCLQLSLTPLQQIQFFFIMRKHIACLLVLKVAELYLFDIHLCPRLALPRPHVIQTHTCTCMHGQQSSATAEAQHHICVSWPSSKRDSPIYTNQHAAAASSSQTHVPPSVIDHKKNTNIILRIRNCRY